MKSAASVLELDYVYTAEDSMDFRNARVSVAVEEEAAKVTITPEHSMTESEINQVLNEIHSDLFKKIRMSLLADCRVLLLQDGKTFRISLEEDQPRVKGMENAG